MTEVSKWGPMGRGNNNDVGVGPFQCMALILINRNGGTVAYMRPHINFTRELLASSARVRDNIGVFSIKIIGRSQRTSRAYQIVRSILSVGSSVRFLKDSFDRIVLSRSDY